MLCHMIEQDRNQADVSRADMHVHSSASEVSRLGVQRSLQLPECATEPEEVYELAKRRGMDFVTLTDHDTIDGALALAHLPDSFVSEELTASFAGEPQAVHVLCYGITPEDHEWLQSHRDDVELCAEYLHGNGITAALAHPFYAVAAPLQARHRRRLAQLFPIWETRNGSRSRELNLPAFVYVETRGGTGIGGSDDHAGIDVGATFTQTPLASTAAEFLAQIRAGNATACGAQGSAAKWTHAAISLAIRSLGRDRDDARPSPGRVLEIVQRLLREGDARAGAPAPGLGPRDAVGLLRAWLSSMDLELDEHELLERLSSGRLGHADLQRRARALHERELARVVGEAVAGIESEGGLDPIKTAGELFEACLPAVPYAAATAFLGREKRKLARAEGERPRVALVADGLGAMHGVTHTIAQIRERGVPGFDVEVIGTDADVDRRLSAVAEIDVPFYPGLRLGVPSVQALVDEVADGRYDLVHVCSPGPAGAGVWGLAQLLELPLVGSYHTELAAYAGVRSGREQLEAITAYVLAKFYGACNTVLSPSQASDERLAGLGIARERIARWDRGVDLARFNPALRDSALLGDGVNVLYAGRLTREKGVELLADAFELAREREPRLRLILAGGGPEEDALRERLGDRATFLGWLQGSDLARAYASADAFLFASQTDTFGQVVLEAQASGLPVVAVAHGGPLSLIEHHETGLLAPAEPDALAEALLTVLGSPPLAERLRHAALASVRVRTWEASLERLAGSYRGALERATTGRERSVA
jgi:glycosyltransferase involved in cell wall biosynthesis/predicted metal-dependent phosphoesterase TrpH